MKQKFKDYVDICPHCFCGTHTLEDGTCGKCGGFKAKVGTTKDNELPPNTQQPPTHNEVEKTIDSKLCEILIPCELVEDLENQVINQLKDLIASCLLAQKKQIEERMPEREIPRCGDGIQNEGEYLAYTNGWNACVAAVKEAL